MSQNGGTSMSDSTKSNLLVAGFIVSCLLILYVLSTGAIIEEISIPGGPTVKFGSKAEDKPASQGSDARSEQPSTPQSAPAAPGPIPELPPISAVPSSSLKLESLKLEPSSVTIGTTLQGRVTLTGPAPSAVRVSLQSSDPALANLVGDAVQVSSNATTATFPIFTRPPNPSKPLPATVTFTATYNGVDMTATLTVTRR